MNLSSILFLAFSVSATFLGVWYLASCIREERLISVQELLLMTFCRHRVVHLVRIEFDGATVDRCIHCQKTIVTLLKDQK